MAKAHRGPHKYKHFIHKIAGAYKCVLPGCTHYISEHLIEDKISLCNRCGQEFVITERMLTPRRIKSPHCDACTKKTFNRASGGFGKTQPVKQVEMQEDDFISKVLGEEE